jgi:uncharacterized membrane protein YuzA (DUF378 family)
VLARRRWLARDRHLTRRLLGIVMATAMMGVAVFALKALLLGQGSSMARLAALMVLVVTGLAVYIAGLRLFGVARLRTLLTAVGSRS